MAQRELMMNPDGKMVPIPASNMVVFREDGRIELLCKHGVGHPIGHIKEWKKWMGTHGCEGCCTHAEFHLESLK